ncbi:MAG: rod shape-determining protein RodA [Elusimicrobia bacterium]|nr:rod shape-determining protein RodA [Elusimicrobiota bacterium]
MLLRAESPGLRSRMDWVLVASVIGLVLIGSVAILSAASPLPFYGQVLQRHFIAFFIGVAAFLIGAGLNYQLFQDQSKLVYVLTLAMLVAVLVMGETMRGQRSWFRLPHFSFQPSELARICMVLVLASFLDKRANKIHTLPAVLQTGALVAPILILILKQPDFSSTLIFFPMILAMLFCSGGSIGHLASLGGYGTLTLGLPLLWTFLSLRPEWVAGSPTVAFVASLGVPGAKLLIALGGLLALALLAWRLSIWMRVPVHWVYFLTASLVIAGGLASAVAVNHQIKSYQRKRFLAFIAPEADPQGAAYNVNQALVAIGSGGLTGKGVFSGTQSQLGFLPERHTDFVFAGVGEEMGFVGAALLLGLYLLLLWRIVAAARLARDRYGYLFCAGLASMLAFDLALNVGMCVGLLPVAGLPLPLVSYGGTNLVVTLWSLGIVANVYARRYALL